MKMLKLIFLFCSWIVKGLPDKYACSFLSTLQPNAKQMWENLKEIIYK